MVDSSFIRLESERTCLRHFEDADLPRFLEYRNNPDICNMENWKEISEEAAYQLLVEQSQMAPGVPGEWFRFAIIYKETGTLIGDCALRIFEDDPRQAEIHFILSPQFQGKGLAFEAISTLIRYIFENLNIHRIIAITNSRNFHSIRLLDRLKFRREGHFIQNHWCEGQWEDEYLYAYLKSEWLNPENQVKTESPLRQNISSGTKWEQSAAFSRAVRISNTIEVSGTTAIDESGNIIEPNNPYGQSRFILTKIERALRAANASLNDVIRTRIYVTDIRALEEVSRAHTEFFTDIHPALTLIEVGALVDPELVVEIEVTAILTPKIT